MKKEMSDYINGMTENNLETLEQIITLQYRKFIQFYKLVKEYSGIITKVKYQFISPSSLDVLLVLNTKRDLSNLKKELEKSMEKSKYDGSVKVVKKNIFISIILEESDGK